MEPEDNFTLINSYNIEESQPRQLPKAVTCNKVTPTPLVPDVSLVFDSKQHDIRICTSNPEPLHEERINSNKCDDNGPRRVKPVPIAPLPNETYASWRTRALNAQSSISSRLPEVAFKSGALKPHSDNTEERFSAITGVRETLNLLPSGKDSNPQKTDHRVVTPTIENSNYGYLNEQIYNKDIRERIIEGNRSSFQKESTPEMCKIQTNNNSSTNKPVMSNNFQENGHYYHAYPTSTLINRADEHNVGLSNEYQSFKSHPELIKEKYGYNKSPVKDQMKQTEYTNPVGQARAQKEPIDDIYGPNRWGESSVSAKDEGSTKKRDALRDLHRIVLLQNEQLKSLQAQVEKLLKKNAVESSRHVPGRGSVVRCVEEGTQTISDTVDVSSVGVMTSFINSNKASSRVGGGDSAADNPNCNCKGCPCSSASSETMTITKTYASQKGDAPRSSIRNMRKMHQVIEEESDESSNSLNGDRASQTRDNNHQISKSEVLQGNDNRGCMPDMNKPLSNGSNACRSSMRGGSSDRGKMGRRSSNSDTGSRDGKTIQERNGQNLKPLESEKCYPEHSSGNRKAMSKNRQNDDEMTMTLNGVDLQTVTEPQLSPEPSIHVDIQDYHEFSGEVDVTSDEDSYYSENEDSSSESGAGENSEIMENRQMNTNPTGNEAGNQEKHNGNTKVGWTFYNNVLGQVNKLLENQEPTHLPPATRQEIQNVDSFPQQSVAHPVVSPGWTSCAPSSGPQLQHPDSIKQKAMPMPSLEVVREATLQHLRQLGIDLSSDQDKNRFLAPMPPKNVPNPGGREFHDSRRVTFDPNSNRGRFGGERRPTETSLKMKSLALKYLSDEQLANCGYMNLRQSSQPEPPKVSEQPPSLAQGLIGEMSSADFTLYGINGTNLSFSTLRYLQRYHLLPSNGTGPAGIWRHQDGNQQANFMEAANARGADLGNTRSPGQIDYTHDYMEGFRQGANMAMGLNDQGEQAHSSTPANKIDLVTPNAKMAYTEKEAHFHQKKGDLPHSDRVANCAGNQMGYSEKKVASKQRSKGKERGQQVPRSKNGYERNRNRNPNPAEKIDGERFQHDNILRESEPKRRVHVDSPKSSNILDITALRQQPKLL